MDTDAQVAQYFAGMWPHLDEHARRLVAASKAVELGYGGISRVSRACGLSDRTPDPRSPSPLLACGPIWPNTPAVWWPPAKPWNWVMEVFRGLVALAAFRASR